VDSRAQDRHGLRSASDAGRHPRHARGESFTRRCCSWESCCSDSRSGFNNLQTLPSDFFPKSAVGSVFGLGGTSAAIASVIYNFGTAEWWMPWGTRRCSWSPECLGPLGLVAAVLLAGRITPIKQVESPLTADSGTGCLETAHRAEQPDAAQPPTDRTIRRSRLKAVPHDHHPLDAALRASGPSPPIARSIEGRIPRPRLFVRRGRAAFYGRNQSEHTRVYHAPVPSSVSDWTRCVRTGKSVVASRARDCKMARAPP